MFKYVFFDHIQPRVDFPPTSYKYIPDQSITPWAHDLIDECTALPRGEHKDQLDAIYQAFNRLKCLL